MMIGKHTKHDPNSCPICQARNADKARREALIDVQAQAFATRAQLWNLYVRRWIAERMVNFGVWLLDKAAVLAAGRPGE